MKKIAIYGKGGIGKSTISANISAVLGKRGLKVMQIGCDPKHDSTLLLNPKFEKTILEVVSENDDYCDSDLVYNGIYGIKCAEVGGPKPGVGCAGRGLIKGISILKERNLIKETEDCIIYDVLGDVVCGGFFEPLKAGLVEVMYVVTSGEFNSLFAANNLCKGYVNSQLKLKNIIFGGIIGNCRGIENEEEILNAFANKLEIPLIGIVPRDSKVEESTFVGEPVVKRYDGTDIANIYQGLAEKVYLGKEGAINPKPIELEELRSLYSLYFLK